MEDVRQWVSGVSGSRVVTPDHFVIHGRWKLQGTSVLGYQKEKVWALEGFQDPHGDPRFRVNKVTPVGSGRVGYGGRAPGIRVRRFLPSEPDDHRGSHEPRWVGVVGVLVLGMKQPRFDVSTKGEVVTP